MLTYIDKEAFDTGFKDFKQGNLVNPYEDKSSWAAKEWERGFNYAYFIVLDRNKTRENYRKRLDG